MYFGLQREPLVALNRLPTWTLNYKSLEHTVGSIASLEQLTLVGDGARNRMVSLADFLRESNAGRPQVMVIDTLNQRAGMDENGSAGMSEVISNIKFLLTLCPDIPCVVHLSGKKKESGPRGHSLFAAMDSCFFLSELEKEAPTRSYKR